MATATPIIQKLRNFLAGRNLQKTLQLRYRPEQTTRNTPQPNLPDGPSHIVSNNYYFTRDGRRLAAPPGVVYKPELKQLAEKSESKTDLPAKRKGIRPGNAHTWTLSTDQPYLS
ncbi:NADH dehydrogenase [ubiquinone] 1 alpha subcomplex subunit 7-like isoform X2 [Anneissia japonica]|uniref:NADH dehydrogenase [ubiquinone] 1 alpha subcomplex subunit 7-like isoform X2 n=1 Tax=Anneissia japonica TaxID=1529436 RepID=UPI001425A733|nr:NADH dehydrogenase [ubiquinone] 1 alpha subcomplex subunit 7-like isoform X2 [Anneissia japonica]